LEWGRKTELKRLGKGTQNGAQSFGEKKRKF